MTTDNKDFVIEALKEGFDKLRIDTPFKIIEKCYQIEFKYQYEKDRSIVQKALKSIVDKYFKEDHEVQNEI